MLPRLYSKWSMKKKFLLLLGLISLSFLIFFNLKTHLNLKSYAYTIPSNLNTNVAVDVSIGEFRFTLFGYASPNALVSLEGMGIYDQTYSNQSGYFEFRNRFSPLAPREACLTAQDQFGRTTTPTCLPPFPTKYDINIGPVLLPPTISLNTPSRQWLNNDNFFMGDEITATGQTIPNTNVAFSIFRDEKDSHGLLADSHGWGFVKPVEAYFFPSLTTKADSKGNFSFSLPSSNPSYFRLFAQTNYQQSDSPKSNGLNLKIYPVWMIIIYLFTLLFSLIKSRILELIILVECILLFLFFLKRYLNPHVIAKSRSLVLRELYPIVEEETIIVPYEMNLPVKISNLSNYSN